jgi:malonyl-CoA decarboxylase
MEVSAMDVAFLRELLGTVANRGRLLLDQQHAGQPERCVVRQLPHQTGCLRAETRPPSLQTFVTLSPVPGFASWLQGEREKSDSDALTGVDHATLALLDEPGRASQPGTAERLKKALMPIAAHYFLQAKDETGRPRDPVARFHLGNGARLERLNWLADTSEKAMRQSHGIMVNYLYSLPDIERNHEAYSNRGMVAASRAVRVLLESGSTRLSRRAEAIEDSHT